MVGGDYFGATDKSPEYLVNMFSGMHFQALAEGNKRKFSPGYFDILYFQDRQSKMLCICGFFED